MTGQPALDILNETHYQWDGFASFESESDLTDQLTELAEDADCGMAALKVLGHIAPHVFLEWLKPHLLKQQLLDKPSKQTYLLPLENAVESIFDVLHTSYGREGGLVDVIRRYGEDHEDETQSLRNHWGEYHKFKNLYQPIIDHFSWHPTGQRMARYLHDFRPQEDEPTTE